MRHDNAFVIGADNRVGLPVSDAAFCGDNRRPLIDIDAVRNQPAPRILALAPVVFFAAVTQVKIQRHLVLSVFPDMLIDALVTDKGDAILRQTAADLIGAPLLLRQFFFDQLHQVRRHFARLVRGLFASLRGLLVRLLEVRVAACPRVFLRCGRTRSQPEYPNKRIQRDPQVAQIFMPPARRVLIGANRAVDETPPTASCESMFAVALVESVSCFLEPAPEAIDGVELRWASCRRCPR